MPRAAARVGGRSYVPLVPLAGGQYSWFPDDSIAGLGRLYGFEHKGHGFPPGNCQVSEANTDRLRGQFHGVAES
jgi:hypothetical protein